MSSPETETSPSSDHEAVLRIVAGLHAGASRPLSRREMVLIGSGDDCDVVLADLGVAPHHALLNVVDGRFHLRALDAPLQLPGGTLHPGDPVEVAQVQRIALGEAAIAFGRADAAEWLSLAPAPGVDAPMARRRPAFASRMPLIAGVAVLALSALAIAAALMPAPPPAVDVEQRLRELAREFKVSDVEIRQDVDGRAVLSGTVDDGSTRARLQSRIAEEGLQGSVALRSGQDLAVDVAEVMRTGGYAVRADYLGNNNVRVTGDLGDDQQALHDFLTSRAMVETGVNKVEPVNLRQPAADAMADAAPAAAEGKAHIVSIVRGETPHIVDADGNVYHDGATVPGWGELVSIGQFAHVIQADGTLVKLTPSPAPAPAPAPVPAAEGGAESAEKKPAVGSVSGLAASAAPLQRGRQRGAADTM
ncbi:FHA domain-containing protein [Luteimonas sp. SDU101]|uniref:FHA domain-containing protein n=1 Tax=Luteimonas sp. SDU101 TaxID=3422593 RepID=UPI003EBCE741